MSFYKLPSGIKIEAKVWPDEGPISWRGPNTWMAEAVFWDVVEDEPADIMWAAWGEPTEQVARTKLDAWLQRRGAIEIAIETEQS